MIPERDPRRHPVGQLSLAEMADKIKKKIGFWMIVE